MNRKNLTLTMVQFSVLLAILAIFCFTPLGSIPVGPIVATLAMLPVIITAILLGTGAGTLMGAFAGFFSFLVWTLMPPSPVVAFVFTPFYSFGDFTGNYGSLLICFVPRVLVGTVTGLTWRLFTKLWPGKHILAMSLSAVLGSVTNTVLVLGGIWLFFGDQYASILGKTILAIIGTTVLTNSIPEAVISAVVAPAVCRPLQKIIKKT